MVGRAKGLWAPRWRSASIPGVTPDDLTSPAENADDGLGNTPLVDKDCHDQECPDELTALIKENASAYRGSEGRVAGGEKDAGHEWGGRGKPHTVVVAAAKGFGEDDHLAGKGSKGAVRWSDGAVRGRKGKGKGGWVKGNWPAVDVQAVQSRLSRIVDDTSARIRSNIVAQVSDYSIVVRESVPKGCIAFVVTSPRLLMLTTGSAYDLVTRDRMPLPPQSAWATMSRNRNPLATRGAARLSPSRTPSRSRCRPCHLDACAWTLLPAPQQSVSPFLCLRINLSMKRIRAKAESTMVNSRLVIASFRKKRWRWSTRFRSRSFSCPAGSCTCTGERRGQRHTRRAVRA